MILINLYNTIRGTLYDTRRLETCAVWYAHSFRYLESANG